MIGSVEAAFAANAPAVESLQITHLADEASTAMRLRPDEVTAHGHAMRLALGDFPTSISCSWVLRPLSRVPVHYERPKPAISTFTGHK